MTDILPKAVGVEGLALLLLAPALVSSQLWLLWLWPPQLACKLWSNTLTFPLLP